MSRYDTPEKRAKHREEQRRYAQKHADHVRETKRKYYESHQSWLRGWHKKRKLTHPGEQYRWRKKSRPFRSARKKGRPVLFVVNPRFKGGHLHHVENHIGAWIPSNLHRSVIHDLSTGEGMVRINETVANWLENPFAGFGETI